jgi:hypothetical protein
LTLTLKTEGGFDLDFGKSKQRSLKSSQSATNGFRSCQEFDLHLEKIRETFASFSEFGRVEDFVLILTFSSSRHQQSKQQQRLKKSPSATIWLCQGFCFGFSQRVVIESIKSNNRQSLF